MKRVLKQAIQDYVAHGSQDALAILDDWEAMTSHKYEGGLCIEYAIIVC